MNDLSAVFELPALGAHGWAGMGALSDSSLSLSLCTSWSLSSTTCSQTDPFPTS